MDDEQKREMDGMFTAFAREEARMCRADITAHPLPFGGLSLVPVSDAGREYLLEQAHIGYDYFEWQLCMTGFPADAIGFEPQDWPEIVTAARDAGLIVEGC